VLTILDAFLIGGGVVLVLLLLVEGIARIGKASFLTSVILGQDNRTSTSKTFIFMWTLLVGWALVSMLIAGELITVHGCVGSLASAHQVTNAIKTCGNMKDQVGLLQIGWHNFIVNGLSGGYLVLLGIPASAAVAAKAITQSKNDSGTVSKSSAPPAKGNIPNKAMARVAQIFSADDGTTDIGLLCRRVRAAQPPRPSGHPCHAVGPNQCLGSIVCRQEGRDPHPAEDNRRIPVHSSVRHAGCHNRVWPDRRPGGAAASRCHSWRHLQRNTVIRCRRIRSCCGQPEGGSPARLGPRGGALHQRHRPSHQHLRRCHARLHG
jgi:hypothetical protein